MDIRLLEVPIGNITRTLLCVGSGQEICHIVGPSSFYLRPLIQSGLTNKFTFTSCDPQWTSLSASTTIKHSTLTNLLMFEHETIQSIKKHFNQTQVGLLGFSAPGCIAVEYARQHPENVAWLKLVGIPIQGTDPSFSESDDSFKARANKNRVANFFLDQEKLQQQRYDSFYAYQVPNDDHLLSENAMAHHAWVQQTMAIYHKAFYTDHLQYRFAYFEHWKTNILGLDMNQRFRDYFFASILSKIDTLSDIKSLASHIPIYIFNGKEDYITPMDAETAEVLADLPSVRLIHYEECGHCPYIENIKVFYNDL